MIKLDTERMEGGGPGTLGDFQVNYLYGLNDLCLKYLSKEKTILELGCNNGVSTSLFAHYCKKVVAVDIAKTPKMEIVLFQNSNIEFYNMFFSDFFTIDKDNKYDLIYVDEKLRG